MDGTVLFVCPHGAAKSVMAAAYFQSLAKQHGLALRGIAAGTHPADTVAPGVVSFLHAEGLDPATHRPRRATRDDIAAAARVISLGCQLQEWPPAAALPEQWDDVPPPSESITATAAVIRARVAHMVEQLLAEQ
jgi:arsenate reductase (thioredoxin)